MMVVQKMKSKKNIRKSLKPKFLISLMRRKSKKHNKIIISDAFFAINEEEATVMANMDTTANKWDAVNKSLCLRSSRCNCVPSICAECNSHHSLLHSILRYDPPNEIVQKILDISGPRTLFQTDCQGRLPLYIAVLYKADYSVVKTLIQNAGSDADKMCYYPTKSETDEISADLDKKKKGGNPTPETKKKTPLHIACEVYDSQFYDLNQDLVIQELYRVAPFTALMEDSDGCIPLELAYLNGCSDALLSKLQDLLRPYEKKYEIMLTEMNNS